MGVAGLPRLLQGHSNSAEGSGYCGSCRHGSRPGGSGGGAGLGAIIAVPVSTGYGASFSGLAALLSMMNSCAPGVAVVNIDNGFGAGYFASQINQMFWSGIE